MKKKNEVKTIAQKLQPGMLARHQHCSLIVSVTRVIFCTLSPEMPTTRNLEIASSSSPFDINQPLSPSPVTQMDPLYQNYGFGQDIIRRLT